MQIVEWYDELLRLTDSPIVRLNRAVAVGEADGPRAGLAPLADLDPDLPRYAAVAAHLHESAGELERRRPPLRRRRPVGGQRGRSATTSSGRPRASVSCRGSPASTQTRT